MDLVAIIIAIVSVVLALGSLLVSYFTYRRDTPKLAVRFNYSIGIDQPASLGVDVTNVGQRMTTLIEVGFRVEFDYRINISRNIDDIPYAEGIAVTKNLVLSNRPTPIGAGEMKQFKLSLDRWPDITIHPDFPLRAYAVGSHGKTCWGHSRPFLREMINAKWQLPADTPHELTIPFPKNLAPMPIYPKWKFWKPEYLRN